MAQSMTRTAEAVYEIRQHTSSFKKYITRWHVYRGAQVVTRGFESREAAQRWLDSHRDWLAKHG